MTTKSNGGPGKSCDLNVLAHCCANAGMRVIFVDADNNCPGRTVRIFFAQSDVSQLKDICVGEGGEKLADTVRKNCNARISLKSGGCSHDK